MSIFLKPKSWCCDLESGITGLFKSFGILFDKKCLTCLSIKTLMVAVPIGTLIIFIEEFNICESNNKWNFFFEEVNLFEALLN